MTTEEANKMLRKINTELQEIIEMLKIIDAELKRH